MTQWDFEFFKWFVLRYDEATDVIPEALANFQQWLQTISDRQEAFMDKLDQYQQETQKKLDDMAAQANKSNAELRKAIDDALKTQVTPEELAEAVAAAKEAQKSASEAEFSTKLDAAFSGIGERLALTQAAVQKLDDIVPDAPVPDVV